MLHNCNKTILYPSYQVTSSNQRILYLVAGLRKDSLHHVCYYCKHFSQLSLKKQESRIIIGHSWHLHN